MLPSNIGVNFFVIPAGVFFLSFSKWYVVGDTTYSSVRLGIIFSYLEWDTHWPGRNTTRPIKFDMPCANVLFGFLHGVSRIPRWFRCQATYDEERRPEDMHNLHNATKDQPG
jgi:hypothetical protein